jgi:hypothetical protein
VERASLATDLSVSHNGNDAIVPEGLPDFVPKGLKDSAWGFNPGYASTSRIRPVRAVDYPFQSSFIIWRATNHPAAPFWGEPFLNRRPGVRTSG